MKLKDIAKRTIPAVPWEEGEKIPWNDPAFSERMLAYHLSQEHDWASRRLTIVQEHVDWLETRFLQCPSRVLDLGCGPGLYTQRLAERGHECVGIDFSPASVAYAKKRAEETNVCVRYHLADIRDADLGQRYDLVIMIFGEFNVFRQTDAQSLLRKAYASLKNGGSIVVEAHTYDEVQRQGQASSSWQANESGLFSDSPHLLLEEHFWDAGCAAATTRYVIVNLSDGEVTIHASTMKAYTDDQYRCMFLDAGFPEVRICQRMGESLTAFDGKLQIVKARKGA